MDLSQEVILIIGAGRGIGRAAAHLFAQAQASIVLASRDDAELAELEFKLNRQTSGQVAAIPTDVTDAAQVKRLIEETLNRFGQIDTLIYAAGFGSLKPFAETGVEEFEQLWRVNTGGAFLALQAALPAMEARKRACHHHPRHSQTPADGPGRRLFSRQICFDRHDKISRAGIPPLRYPV